MIILRNFAGFCLALLLSAAAAQDLTPIPPLKARVTDLAGMLQVNQRAELESKLKAHEDKTGSQVVVLLVKSTAPEVIEQYGIRVADAWKVGRKGIDDGVILIFAKDNTPDLRRMRLEVGRGAEGIIPDARAKQVLQDIIAPKFREGDFVGGLHNGVDAIHSLLDKEPFPEPEDNWWKWVVGIMSFMILAGIILRILEHFNLLFPARNQAAIDDRDFWFGRSSSAGSSGDGGTPDNDSFSGGRGGGFSGGGASGNEE